MGCISGWTEFQLPVLLISSVKLGMAMVKKKHPNFTQLIWLSAPLWCVYWTTFKWLLLTSFDDSHWCASVTPEPQLVTNRLSPLLHRQRGVPVSAHRESRDIICADADAPELSSAVTCLLHFSHSSQAAQDSGMQRSGNTQKTVQLQRLWLWSRESIYGKGLMFDEACSL